MAKDTKSVEATLHKVGGKTRKQYSACFAFGDGANAAAQYEKAAVIAPYSDLARRTRSWPGEH